jgi:predicted RNase H-like nuclease (RuvC/YqgF family)
LRFLLAPVNRVRYNQKDAVRQKGEHKMTEEKNVAAIMKQIENFENTIKSLQANVDVLKSKLAEKKAKYGDDINKWPKE